MSRSTLALNDDLRTYLINASVAETPLLAELREETAKHPLAVMQISPEQGQFLRVLVGALGVRRALEIGVFTGYSSLCTLLALPKDGVLVGCDINPETSSMAKRYVERAGLSSMYDLRLGPASETLASLAKQGAMEFDFAFIDADKSGYWSYFEGVLALLRPGGLIAIDNVLWGGRVLDQNSQAVDTRAIIDFNERLRVDERVCVSMLPIGDGLTLARKL